MMAAPRGAQTCLGDCALQQIYVFGLISSCGNAARVKEMQAVVTIMLIGSVMMVAIAALDHPNG